jgi:RNA-directed DNA polymerase
MTNVINDTKHDFWSNINWIKVNKIVTNLQRRIFVAKQQGNFRKLRKLQNLLLSSKANKLLAVRQVCFKNLGGNILVIDKRVYGTPKEKMELVYQLYKISLNKWKPLPVRGLYIKKVKGKLNFINIKTLIDYVLQAIVRNALEPEWEASFESSNYKFRQSDSVQDVITYLHKICDSKLSKHWIVNGNIKGCFNNLSKKFLMNQLSNFPAKGLILKWLKAGYLNNCGFHDSSFGTESGINPLLVNIVFNGVKETISIKKSKNSKVKLAYIFIHYANNFIMICRTKESAIEIKATINYWLKLSGFSLFSDKTRIINLSQGFDFLGFNLRLYKTNNLNKILIKPNSQSQIKIRQKLKLAWKECLGSPINKTINKINLILKSWANYYKIGLYCRIFAQIDYYNWIRQYRFAKRTHPKKSWKWIQTKYWGKLFFNQNDKWVFGCFKSKNFMYKLSWTSSKLLNVI